MVDVGFSLGSWFTVCFMGPRWLILFANSMLFMGASCGGCLLFGGFLYSWDIGRLVVEMCYGKASRGKLFWRGVMCDLGLWGRLEIDG